MNERRAAYGTLALIVLLFSNRWVTSIIRRDSRGLLYRLVARFRHRFPGTTETCRLPTPAEQRRLL